MWILRQTRRLQPPYLRAFHLPSPSTLKPVLSAARQGIAQQCPRGDQKVQWAVRAAIRNVDRKRPLTAADGAKVRDVPIESRQPQQAFHKARSLTQGHPEQHLHRQECMFADSKTKGLNLEDTRMELSKKLSLLMEVCAIALAMACHTASRLMGSKYPARKKHGYCSKSWFRTGFDELRRRLRTNHTPLITGKKYAIRKRFRPRVA
ncbi:hypothetical protein P775_04820 [Puniceibacterium antarcticum]|uniref:Transposase DDE domain-containing protein n=1 Tax=Puniceibacterium antarcticum TaxID=1206336 RepID=A0A2G8RI99_9RHOB|nr:hypothetical protein P775_04820 [Puniceibacterium antarcticum]